MLRDLDHWKAYRDSKLFADLVKGYDDKTRHKIVALTYYGAAPCHRQQADQASPRT